MEQVIIFYDITEDSLRLRVSELLKDYGLERIQMSAFHGYLKDEKLKDLEQELEKLIITDLLHIVKICNRCSVRMKELGFAITPERRDMYVF